MIEKQGLQIKRGQGDPSDPSFEKPPTQPGNFGSKEGSASSAYLVKQRGRQVALKIAPGASRALPLVVALPKFLNQ